MLPPRSKRFAGTDGQIERLRLITPWELGVAVVLLMMLFALIFPRRALIEALHEQERLDDLTLAYIENLRHVETGDDDLTILVTRLDLERLDYGSIEARLQPIVEKGDPRLQVLAARLLAKARLLDMRRILATFDGSPRSLEQLRRHYRYLRNSGDSRSANEALSLWIESLKRLPARRLRERGELKDELAQVLADLEPEMLQPSERLATVSLAMIAGKTAEAQRLLASLDIGFVRTHLPQEAALALGQGHYETAAMLYILARENAADQESARQTFRQAIETLMAGGLHALALETAERHLGNLANDAPTLRFLVKTALAAGDPQRAADYARRLIFVPKNQEAQ